MAFISVTRLRLRSLRFLPGFAPHFLRTRRQAGRAPGFQDGSLLADRGLAFWTLTAWNDQASMRGYMVAGPHREAMPHLLDWCDEAAVVHWERSEPGLPSWSEADRRLREDGRSSAVRHPSLHHAARDYRPPRLFAAAPIRPATPAPP